MTTILGLVITILSNETVQSYIAMGIAGAIAWLWRRNAHTQQQQQAAEKLVSLIATLAPQVVAAVEQTMKTAASDAKRDEAERKLLDALPVPLLRDSKMDSEALSSLIGTAIEAAVNAMNATKKRGR